MPCIFLSIILTEKHVSEVSTTVIAENFSATAVGIRLPFDGPFYLVVEAGPAAVGFELRRRFIKRCITSCACINSLFVMIVIFAGKGDFGALVNDNPLLFAG